MIYIKYLSYLSSVTLTALFRVLCSGATASARYFATAVQTAEPALLPPGEKIFWGYSYINEYFEVVHRNYY